MAAAKVPPDVPTLEDIPSAAKSRRRRRNNSNKFQELLRKTKREEFQVLSVTESNASRHYEISDNFDNVHIVTLGETHHCTCSSLQEKNHVCSSTIFVLLRALQVKETNR